MNSLRGKCVKKGIAILMALIMMFPVFLVQASAFGVDYTLPESELPSLELGAAPDETQGASFVNITGDGGENTISMTSARTFEVTVPLEMSEADAKTLVSSSDFSWTLSRTEPYLNTELYPNYKTGGSLSAWKDSGNKDLFGSTATSVYKVDDDTVNLKMTVKCSSYYSDGSIPQGAATQAMDYIGWYSLAAVKGDKTLGSVAVKVVPYDHFRTMGEVYDEIEALDDYNSGYYTEEFSMGKSESGYDMPFLIVARDEAAVDNWLDLCERAETEPDKVLADLESGALSDYQVPVIFSNIHSNETAATDAILDFAWMLLKEKDIDYNVLNGFTKEGKAQLAKEMGDEGEDGSLAVPDLVKDMATYRGFLTVDNYNVDKNTGAKYPFSGPVKLDTYYNTETDTVDVPEMLDDVFFILVPEENVEGRIFMSRVASGGLDLNRDNSFQTQNETQNMQKLIGTFNPACLTELHGRVTSFQCEPCDPPHEPNFEYDLLARHLMPGGEAFGVAAVANNDGYNSYVIPQRDYLQYTGKVNKDSSYETYWADPWDDMSTSYTPQFAMLHGCVSYTVELPAYNDKTAKAAAFGQLGQADYVAANKEDFFKTQLEIFKRGVNNENSDAFDLVGQWFCDQNDVEGAEADLFRPEYDGAGENGNFYPECYIIPLDQSHQSNLQAAYDMMKWLSRNDVKVLLSDQAFSYQGETYPAGTMIIPMYQAKRSVANSALYDGTLITNWTVLYSEGITTFNETRGFDMKTCAKPEEYKAIAAACGEPMDYEGCLKYLAAVTSAASGSQTGYQVIISNASEDSTAAVNELLKKGKPVGLITDGSNKGDYICSYADWLTVSDDFILTGTCISKNYPKAQIIKKSPVIYINGKPSDSTSGYIKSKLIGAYNYNYDRQAMDLLNFKTTSNLADADIIIGSSALDSNALPEVQAGKPYIGYGSGATGANRLDSFFSGITRKSVSGSMDALAYVTYPAVNLINASYASDGDDVMYGYGAGYFNGVPDGAQVLVRIDGSRKPTEGFLRSSDPENLSAFLNGSIQGFSYEGKDKNGNGIDVAYFANSLTHKVHQRDEYAFISNFAFSNLLGADYTAEESHSGHSSHTTTNEGAVPKGVESASEKAVMLADNTFTDVSADDWYAESVGRMIELNLMNGTTPTKFSPGSLFDRGMMATVLYRIAGTPAVTGTADFRDVPGDAWYAKAVTWGFSKGIVNGYDGSYGPAEPITREQVVVILYRYAKSTGLNVAADDSLAGFSDRNQISDFAVEAMNWAVANGIISGNADKTLKPQATATRAEVAAMLMRAMELF